MGHLIELDVETARANPYSYKWGILSKDCIPMGVADMDFKAPDFIVSALQKYLQTGMYGYYKINSDFYAAICSWYERTLNLKLDPASIIPTTGVLASLRAIIYGHTAINDKILIQEPVYPEFKNIIMQLQRSVVVNQLQLSADKYSINFDLLEEQLKNGVKLFILCSPHNPVGRLWGRATITTIAELCRKYNVCLVADEIHSDLCRPSQSFYSACQLPENLTENCLILNSPSKAFNMSGLHGGYVIVPNKNLQLKVKDYLIALSAEKQNAIFITATIAAYTHGHEWLKEVISYINNNYIYLVEYLRANAHYLKVCDLQATYLVWIDYSGMRVSEQQLIAALSDTVAVVPGSAYGESGEYFFRLTIACPKNILEKALERIVNACHSFI